MQSMLPRLDYVREDAGELVESIFMEPLAGLLRDPRPICWGSLWEGSKHMPFWSFKPPSTDVQGKYVLLDPAAALNALTVAGGYQRKAILIDMGASRWFDPGGF